MLASSTSSTFLTINYLIDLIKVFLDLGGGRPPLPGRARLSGSGGARAASARSSGRPLRKAFWIQIDGSIAPKQLSGIRRQVILIISAKAHRPQLIVVGVVGGHRRSSVPHGLHKEERL